MFDPDAGYAPIIRLDDLREAIDADQSEAIAHREMTEATMRWIDARMKADAIKAQNRPIPMVQAIQPARCTLTGNPCGTDTVAAGKSCPDQRNGGHCAKVSYGLDEGTRPMDGVVQFSTDNDFWTHRHRVLSGTTPMIARSSGHIDRITAAAAGEIEDPAAPLRKAHDGTYVIRDFLEGLDFDPKDAGAVKDRT